LDNVIYLFTDGACAGNPGPGGYGLILRMGKHYKELSQGYRLTTNNRMEMMAVIVGLESIKLERADVLIQTDSQYIINAVEKKWVYGWLKKGFAGKANEDLWRRFLKVYEKHNVKFKWIKGHNGHPENERCDALAVAASKNKESHLIDEGFEQAQSSNLLF
jgi:ribonuclease HI